MLAGSAAFVLDIKKIDDLERIKSFKIVAVDYSGRETTKEIHVQKRWIEGARNTTLENRSFVVETAGKVSF